MGPDGVTVEISGGTLRGVGQIFFYSEDSVAELFAEGWKILSQEHLELASKSEGQETVHAEWRVVAEKA